MAPVYAAASSFWRVRALMGDAEPLPYGNNRVTIALHAIQVLEYLDAYGRSPFRRWFDGLDAVAAPRIGAYLYRLEAGNFSRVEGVGAGVFELKVDFGPGYRVYFGKDGDTVVVLLGGGTKKGQSKAVALARERWEDYKRRKRA